MNKFLTVLSMFVIFLCIISSTISAAPVLKNAHYIISGDGNDLNALKLDLNYNFNNINSFDALFTYYDSDIKAEGSWIINFFNNGQYKLNLELALATGISDISFEPAIGFSGISNYKGINQLFWDIKYFVKENVVQFVYNGGIMIPVSENAGKITLGFGNSYWYRKKPQINIGFMVDF